MKKSQSLLIFMAIMSLMACKDKTAPELKSSELPITIYSSNIHVITLYVNTTDIEKPNIGDFADFGQPDSISNEEYTTYVRKGDMVIWKGVSLSDSLDVVNITQINHQGGARLFGKNVLNGNGGDNEVVVGVITKESEMKDGTLLDEEKYVLKFTVYNKGEKRNGTFQIDPKIRSH